MATIPATKVSLDLSNGVGPCTIYDLPILSWAVLPMMQKPRWSPVSSLNTMMERLIEMSRLSTRLEFESFEALPCGCVAGAYRALPWAMSLVRLEAKGPHCPRLEHELDHVLDVEIEDEEDGAER